LFSELPLENVDPSQISLYNRSSW